MLLNNSKIHETLYFYLSQPRFHSCQKLKHEIKIYTIY